MFVFTISYSQSAKADFEKLNKNYFTLTKLSYNTNYFLYIKNSSKPVETYNSVFKKNGNNFYSKNPDEEYLVNSKYIVFIDHEDKDILIQKNSSKENPDVNKIMDNVQNISMYVDTLMQMYSKVEPIIVKMPDTKAYRLYTIGGPYSKVEMFINTKTWLINELILYFNEKEEINGKEQEVNMKIQFTNYNTKPTFLNDFSESKYLTNIKGVFKLKPNYLNYELHDETN